MATPAGAMVEGGTPVTEPSAFPIQAAHDFGTENNAFGGARDHRGQDVFAACGAPVVAAMPGRVTRAEFEPAGGNYAVITSPNGRSQVYMHLRKPARVAEGEAVELGAPLGAVGATGDADGCHLHFELWTAPGWFKGAAVDPLPALERWDR